MQKVRMQKKCFRGSSFKAGKKGLAKACCATALVWTGHCIAGYSGNRHLWRVVSSVQKERYRMLVAILAGYGLLMFLTILRALQLPTLMEIKRVSIFIAYFSPMVFAWPIELLYQWTKRWNQSFCFMLLFLACIPVVVVMGMDYEVVHQTSFYYFQPKEPWK